VIVADLSNMSEALQKRNGPNGEFWKVDFEVGILFGGNELEAKLFWKDWTGTECQSRAKIIPKQFS